MKNIRALGIDDSYFVPHRRGKVDLVGVVMRKTYYIDGFLIRKIDVDGMDSTEKIIDMVESKYNNDIKIVMTQGITFGGFNIFDIGEFYEKTNKPVIVISRKKPDMESIITALKSHFDDWERRVNLISSYEIKRIKNGDYKIYIQHEGIIMEDAEKIIREFTIRGAIPEPLRVAHLLASSLHFGESKGKV